MSYRPHPRDWWEKETAFIEGQADLKYRMGSFDSYCVMQAKFAAKDGFEDLAARINNARERKTP